MTISIFLHYLIIVAIIITVMFLYIKGSVFMKIISNNYVSNIVKAKSSPAFMQNPLPAEQTENLDINRVTPDYNINKPISYNKIEDINLGNNLTAHYYKLANGQKVVIIPKKGTTVVKTYVNTGSLNEPDKYRGISHYIEHNLFNGSESLGDTNIFDTVNKMGAYANASTSFSVTDYILESNLLEDTDLETKIKLQAGMLQTPKFLEDKLEKEKKIVDSEINMYLSDDTTKAQTLTLKNLFNIKSSAPDLIAGSTENIDALTRDDVVNYYKNNYHPGNMVTVITGEVDEAQTIGLVSKYFNAPAQNVLPQHHEQMNVTDKPVREDIISSKKTGATDIFMGFEGPQNGNEKDFVYLRAVNQLLFGLAHARIKNIEQKYSTSISQTNERLGTRQTDSTATIIHTAVPEEYTENILKDIYATLGNLANNPPTDKEFQALKTQIKKTNSVFTQSSGALNYHIGSDFLNNTPYRTAKYIEILDNMTKEDFINTVKKYYNLDKTAITVVHPNNTTADSINNNYKKANNISFTGKNIKNPIDINKIEEYTMPNNFDVVMQDSDTDVANYTLKIFTKDLSPKKAAAGEILNDMLQYCGTKSHTWQELAQISDLNGIDSSITGSINSVSISGDAPVENFTTALNLFKENVQQPDLNQELFNNALKHCKDKYQTSEPNAYEPFKKAMNEGLHTSYTTEDKIKSLDNITLEDIKQLYNEIMQNGQGQLVITAPFSKRPELKQAVFNVSSQFAPLKPKNTNLYECYTPINNTQVYTVETNRNQAEIIEGFKFKHTGNIKDEICLDILNSIFGDGQSSRLFNDLREQRHLAYAVYSSCKKTGNFGVEYLRIKTTTNNTETGEKTLDNIKKSIEGFNENIKKITTEKVSPEELETAKRTIKSQLLSTLEMNTMQNSIIGMSVKTPYGINYINEQFKIIDSITAEDILNTAQNVFGGKAVYSISGTKEALESNKDFLNSLTQN